MKRLIIEFLTIPIAFFLLWFVLSRIDYVKHFRINERLEVNEKKLGNLLTKAFLKSEKELDDDKIVNPINIIKDRICFYNYIYSDSIKVIISSNDEINAFALPNRTIIIYSGLIRLCKNPEELGCVIAHEIAHIENKHVMKKLVKEVGISMLSSYLGGNNNSEVLKAILKRASSTAYDRKFEDEADEVATRYLIKAHIKPSHFADFLNRISEETDIPSTLVFLNTHPNSKERALKISKIETVNTVEAKEIIPNDSWALIQESLK